MALMNDIGGFFVSLGLNPDKNSFETGNKLIDGVGNSLNKLIGAARNAAVVLATTAVATANVESKTYKTSQAIGITTESFNLLKAAAKIAGVNTEGLLNSVGKLGSALNRLKFDPSGVKAYQEQLWKLGIHFSEIKDMAADDAFAYIMNKAQSLTGQYSAAELAARVEDVLGSDAMNFFIELQDLGVSYDQFMAGASRTQIADAETTKKLVEFQRDINTLKTTTESLTTKIGGDIGEILSPYVEKLNTFLEEHGDEIAEKIVLIADGMVKLVEKLVSSDAAKAIVESSKGVFKATVDMVKAVADGDFEAAGEAYIEGTKAALEPISAVEEKMSQSENPIVNAIGNGGMDEAAAEVVAGAGKVVKSFFRKGWNWIRGKGWQDDANEYNPTHQETANDPDWWMDDGIMRPDGTITRVAPDDWVFAARNVGDLARAFIPQGITAGTQVAEYSIVQNFTINGGSDMPQVLRQQAYNGVQEGLIAVMNQSAQRMQMMSGTR